MYKITKFYKIGLCFAFFSEFIAIYPLYNLIFKDSGISPIYIATLLIIQKTSKMLFDIPSGFIADIYGRRSIFIFGIMLKIGMLLLFLIKPCFISFAIAMTMWGMAMSCFFGNEAAYTYDFLRIKKSENKFSRFMGLYYVAQNIATAMACFVGGILYDGGNAQMAIILSIFMMLVTLFFALQLPKYTNNQMNIVFPNENKITKNNFSSYLSCISNPKTMFFVVLLAISTALFLFFFDLSTVIMNDHNYSIKTVSIVVGIVASIRILGNLISGFIAPKTPISFILLLMILLVSFVGFGAITNNTIVVIAISCYLIFFTLIDLTITTKMQIFINSQLRATVMSISNLFASILLIALHFINGYIAEQESYMVATLNIMSIIFCLLLFMVIAYIYAFRDKSSN